MTEPIPGTDLTAKWGERSMTVTNDRYSIYWRLLDGGREHCRRAAAETIVRLYPRYADAMKAWVG